MRQAWKGLVVGAITGAAIGLVMDALAGMSKRAIDLADGARQHAPAAGQGVRDAADRAAGRVRDVDLTDVVHHVASRFGDRVETLRASGS